MSNAAAVAPRGLEGIVATTSSICFIDGEAGVLSYRGIDIHELASKSTFEETTYLLWHGALPTAPELQQFSRELAGARQLPPRVLDFLRSVPTSANCMDVLRTAVSLLALYDAPDHDTSHVANLRKSFQLTAQIPMIVALFDRVRKSKALIEADPALSHAANFLWMLTGEKPSATATRAFDVALILHADHELNASTFAARVIAATLADMHSAITGAIGALSGPLHGGANEATMRLLFAIDQAGTDPVEHVREMLARKEKISGFGHRVYRTEDPRATHRTYLPSPLRPTFGAVAAVRSSCLRISRGGKYRNVDQQPAFSQRATQLSESGQSVLPHALRRKPLRRAGRRCRRG